MSDTSFVGNEGWAVTGGADVLHTTDGGATWTDQATGENDSLYAVRFISATEGWATGDWGTILHTVDGGATWERQVGATLDTLYDIEFVDADHGWLIGMASVLATTDGGATWTLQIGDAIFTDWYWYGPDDDVLRRRVRRRAARLRGRRPGAAAPGRRLCRLRLESRATAAPRGRGRTSPA